MKNNFENIPNQMKEEAYFCTHYKKTPTNNTKPNDKKTFYSYDEMMKIKKDYEGIGIGIFDSYCGIDIDHCIDDKGSLSEVAKDIIKTIKSYTEKSLSGTGIHIIFKCENQEQINSMKYYTKMNENQLQKNGFKETGGLEIYQGNFDNRYLTLTGNAIIKELATIDFDTIKKVIEKYMKKPESNYQSNLQKTTTYQNNTSEDKDFLQIGLQKDDKLIELWNSTPSGSGGNESETDQALMNKLSYWCNNNEALMIQSFESSPYFQRKDDIHLKKWNEREDYKSRTIQNAISQTSTTAKQMNEKFIQEKEKKESEARMKQEEPIKNQAKELIESGNALQQLDSFFEVVNKETFKPIPTGFTQLDENLNGGLSMQSIVILNGGTSTGKTTYTLNLCLKLAKERPILYFTLEMSKEQILAKVYSNIAKTGGGMSISSTSILQSYDKNKMIEYQKGKLIEEIKKHDELNNFFVIFPEESTIDYIMKQINAITEQLKSEGKQSPLIVIDYLQFIQGGQREDSQSLIKRIQRSLKKYAIEEQSLVFLLSANSREKNKGESSIDSGRDTSDIEYTADYLFALNFYEWEHNSKSTKTRKELTRENPRKMTITIHKQRFGGTGLRIDYSFNGIANTFEEIEEKATTTTQTTKRI